MTSTEEKDWVLAEINKVGVIDMNSTPDSQLIELFSRHQSTLLNRRFIERERSPIGNPFVSYLHVQVTDAGRDFLVNGGFKKEEEKINAEIADRLDIKLATIRTAKWQAIGVIASLVIGLSTIAITGVTAYFTITTDNQEKSIQEKRLNRLEHLVDSMQTRKSQYSPLRKAVEPILRSDSTVTL